ncbi:probable serine/threonine-protein kinase At1g01540 [Lotus japonicus]|uniref:probable serine/threonine-protein kinase At1g01540 n=1 Tax=Lotus japonicus TaxID=34305 RepID=UPI002585893B|nr:probable serine/threonine-protein kinase At1g01540 [Lotus japonicus]
MEEIGHVKHNNLVKLLGYCAEGVYRMSVSEYVDNGNLHYWLHEFPGQVSPLTWTIRSNIIHNVAKGLAYLHEENKPKILPGSIKSSTILLDENWNPNISDYGLAKLLSPESSHILFCTCSSHVSTNTSIEGSDIYGFGVLMMEIISGKIHVLHSQLQGSL